MKVIEFLNKISTNFKFVEFVKGEDQFKTMYMSELDTDDKNIEFESVSIHTSIHGELIASFTIPETLLEKYARKFGVQDVENDYGEKRTIREHSIPFENGWVASIVENNGTDVYHTDGKHTKEFKSKKKYSVAACDYNGYFDWSILNQYGAIDGCIYCDDEIDIIVACEHIRNLKRNRRD